MATQAARLIPESPSTASHPWWTSAWIAPLAAVLVYLHTCWFGFVIDDGVQIGQNATTHSLRNIPGFFFGDIFTVFNGLSTNYYRPLFWSTLAVEYRAFGLHAWGFHLVNVLLHAGVCYLVYRLALAIGLDRGVATLAALLFAVQPAHVEAVAWVSAIPEIMMAMCVLGSFLLYLRFRRTRGLASIALAALLFLTGLLFKETAMVLPVLILFYEAAFGKVADAFRPRVVIAYGGAFVLYLVSRSIAVSGFFRADTQIPFTVEMLTWPEVLAFYLRHLLVPVRQSAYYDHYYVAGFGRAFWAPTVVLLSAVTVFALVWHWSRRKRLLAFCAAAGAISIVPVLHLRVFLWRELAHDRYLYLASVFFCLGLAALLADARWPRMARVLAIAAIVGAYSAVLVAESLPWRSEIEVYRHARVIAPENVRPKFGYAVELINSGHFAEAERQLDDVVRLAPNWFEPRFALGQIAFSRDQYADAEAQLASALALRPDFKADVLLAAARMRMGHFAAAEQPLRDALAIAPSTAGLHYELGRCLAASHRVPDAKSEFQLEIAAGTTYADAASQELSKLDE
jgi:tetratricopeptide (TPR) repeat protein